MVEHKGLTHVDETGAARMVDVSAKAVTVRRAVAAGRVTTRAARFGIGATIGPFTAKSTSGYSSRVDMTWSWVRNWGYLCGSNNYPPLASIVYAF